MICKEFAVSPEYFELGSAPPEIENEINRRIKIFVNGASQGPLYFLVRFLFASICFHYDDLKINLSETNRVRASTMFIEATGEIRSYATSRYPWNKTCNTSIFTQVPHHVMIMVEMEELKTVLKDQQKQISADLRDELNKRHVGGDAFEASGILEEVTKAYERTLDALGLGHHQHRKNESCLEGYLHVGPIIDEHDIQEEGRAEGRAGADLLRERPLGVVVAWRNCLGGKIRLLPESFVFTTMPLPNLVRMWYCRDVPSNIPPYKMLQTCGVSHLKYGKCKMSQIKKLMGHVEQAASIVN